jgi:hypothetical protein
VYGVNLWAALVAAVSSFVLGGLWYSPLLFGKAWQKEANAGTSGVRGARGGPPARAFGLSFAFAMLGAVLFALWLGPKPTLLHAITAGAMAGFGFVAVALGINYQFANRSFRLYLIDGGYHSLQFMLFGVILGLWH